VISWPVARAAALEKLRSRAIVVIGVCFAAAAGASGRAGAPGEAFGGFGMVFLLVLTLALGAGLLSDELDSGHAQLVLLRPITRAAWLGGRLAGAGIALAAVLAAAWLLAVAGAGLRGGDGLSISTIAVLPLALLWAFAWLSVLAALGAVLPGWTNAVALVLAGLVWAMLRGTLPAALRHPEWAPALDELTSYLGPQDPLQLAAHPRAGLGAALYDVVWVFFAWLVAVLLFNRRELARRRT
jgi:hypothetical protein